VGIAAEFVPSDASFLYFWPNYASTSAHSRRDAVLKPLFMGRQYASIGQIMVPLTSKAKSMARGRTDEPYYFERIIGFSNGLPPHVPIDWAAIHPEQFRCR
jgi:hypothetical protein